MFGEQYYNSGDEKDGGVIGLLSFITLAVLGYVFYQYPSIYKWVFENKMDTIALLAVFYIFITTIISKFKENRIIGYSSGMSVSSETGKSEGIRKPIYEKEGGEITEIVILLIAALVLIF